MSTDFLPFALPEIGEEEIAEVVDSLRSGWVTTGPKAKRFEEQFSAFLGDEKLESIAVNSATSGLHLALEAIGVGPGDEVIVPTYTFTATAEIVRYLGATPIMVDVEESTFNMTPTAFEAAISEKTKAVIPVHFAGLACDMDEFISIARKHDIRIIEDAAHALPTVYNGKLIGTLDTDVTVFSFYANKTMTTGEGGMVVTRNQDIAKRCKIMRLHGISRDAFDRYTSTKPAWSYEIVAPGYKYNMPDISAAIGLHQLVKLPDFQIKRQRMAEYYNQQLKDLPIVLPSLPNEESSHAWHLYPIKLKVDAGISRDDFILKMSELGIGCSVHFIPLHLHPYWRDTYNLTPEMYPTAQSIFEAEVSLPLYTKMNDEDLLRVVNAVKQVLTDG
ncbi:UDP-4-amino-4,6-dideoxy-N-acetyl-beta-L-altrosamine transaminase [Vibrio cidicii]|uniref:DegT/DnrJ/EryC1/StrS family aminotransferase n=1 Tax=Vibrio TaxID=662 RepID=UPI001302306B|nr:MULTISPECIES: DegT/DnrJ/EryC1/StrS family aminotransferase [Vibrio]EJL6399102.1 DegT/DnrJ/EryC1/StrS family aminotransferase [Vibrio navarrensis]EJL6567009.1 DegT/DnrJ/EryC1/StrS family aminotransferase [Vibrio navarrensis]MBG0760714.1 UDP-4-amino-4,6-dideoxy-N-acetyl-beta-L-altrosamine transaminase [Vibrio cidicii]